MDIRIVDISDYIKYYYDDKKVYNKQADDNVQDVLNALTNDGFLILQGHSITDSIISNAVASSSNFFHQNESDKRLSCSKDRARRGYSPSYTDNYSSLLKDNTHLYSFEQRPNDHVEKFRIGPFVTKCPNNDNDSLCDSDNYYRTKESKVHFYPNDFDHTPVNFKENVLSYYQSMECLSSILLSMLEKAFQLEEHYFTRKCDKHTSILSINYFNDSSTSSSSSSSSSASSAAATSASSASSVDTSTIRIAEHTDVSLITIVYQTDVSSSTSDTSDANISTYNSGLEIYNDTDWSWHLIKYVPDTFIINIGDCFHNWSRKTLKSTCHRVRMKDNLSRMSFAYFVTPNYNALLDNWPSDVCNGSSRNDSSSDQSIEYNTWRKNRIMQATRKK